MPRFPATQVCRLEEGSLKVAYLANGYPRTSHSFIRREIRALESLGVEVLRFAQRPLDEPLVNEVDREEHQRTRVVLAAGVLAHARAVMAVAVARPLVLARALFTALRLGRRSERGLVVYLAYLAEAALLLQWLRGSGARHLHAHFGTPSATVAMFCRCLGGPPYSFTIHGMDEYDNVHEKVSRAAFVVAVSSFGRAQLYRRVDLADWPRIHQVHCGVEADMVDAPLTRVPDAPRLVCVARLHVEKGHLVLLEAAARLAAQGVPFELVLVGDGPLRPVIEERVRSLGLGDRVRLAGWTGAEQVRDEILAARALVLSSFTEGLPVVLMEALALGRPVIASALSGIPELVIPGVDGWLVPAGAVEELVEAMREALAASPSRLGELGRAGAALVAERHDSRKEARELMALFQAAAEGIEPVGGRARAARLEALDAAPSREAPAPRSAAR